MHRAACLLATQLRRYSSACACAAVSHPEAWDPFWRPAASSSQALRFQCCTSSATLVLKLALATGWQPAAPLSSAVTVDTCSPDMVCRLQAEGAHRGPAVATPVQASASSTLDPECPYEALGRLAWQ